MSFHFFFNICLVACVVGLQHSSNLWRVGGELFGNVNANLYYGIVRVFNWGFQPSGTGSALVENCQKV